jgi:hypothetical protein
MQKNLSLSEIMKKMSTVNEPGLFEQKSPLVKNMKQAENSKGKLSSERNSTLSHSMNYDKVVENQNASKQESKKESKDVVLAESDRAKVIGALQVMKEMLQSDVSKDPFVTLNGLKKIIDSF